MSTPWQDAKEAIDAIDVDYTWGLDDKGVPFRHEFIALHSERPDADHYYSNGMYGMPIPESPKRGEWVFDTSDWPKGERVTYESSWKGERCMSISELPHAITIDGGNITVVFGQNGGDGSFEPVGIPARLQGGA